MSVNRFELYLVWNKCILNILLFYKGGDLIKNKTIQKQMNSTAIYVVLKTVSCIT